MFDATVPSTDLAAVLSTAQRMVSTKPAIPVLGNVLIKAEGDSILVSATDTEIGLKAKVKASSVSPGEVTISARLLHELVRSLPTTSVRLLADAPDSVSMTAAGFRGKLATQPASDFPTLPDVPVANPVSLPRIEFRDAIARTRFAITEGDTRYYLNGARLEPSKGSFRLVATDGHRLAIVDADRVGDAGDPSILPKKTLDALGSMLENSAEESVKYVKGENHIFFQLGDAILISRVIDGSYPAYERIIPPPADVYAQLDRAAFLSAIRRMLLVSDQKTGQAKFSLVKNALVISTKSTGVGDADENVAANYADADKVVGLNARYVAEFLDAAGTNAIEVSIIAPERQVVFRAVGGAVSYRYVVMPVALERPGQ